MKLMSLLWVVFVVTLVDCQPRSVLKKPINEMSNETCRSEMKKYMPASTRKICEKAKKPCDVLKVVIDNKHDPSFDRMLEEETRKGRKDCGEITEAYLLRRGETVGSVVTTIEETPVACKRGKLDKAGVNCVKGKCVKKTKLHKYLLKLWNTVTRDLTNETYGARALTSINMYTDRVEKIPDHLTTCLCDKGKQIDPYCSKDCEPGTYGEYCLKQCGHCMAKPCSKKKCKPTPVCHPATGKCHQCQPMYKPPYCKTLVPCAPKKTCYNGVCANSTYCVCDPGYYGYKCKTKCKSGWFGSECAHTCSENCRKSCERKNGTCIKGCKDPYFGSHCNETAKTDDDQPEPTDPGEVRAQVQFVLQKTDEIDDDQIEDDDSPDEKDNSGTSPKPTDKNQPKNPFDEDELNPFNSFSSNNQKDNKNKSPETTAKNQPKGPFDEDDEEDEDDEGDEDDASLEASTNGQPSINAPVIGKDRLNPLPPTAGPPEDEYDPDEGDLHEVLDLFALMATTSKHTKKSKSAWKRLTKKSRKVLTEVRRTVKPPKSSPNSPNDAGGSNVRAKQYNKRRDQERRRQERRDQERRGQGRRGQGRRGLEKRGEETRTQKRRGKKSRGRRNAILEQAVEIFEGLVLMYYSTCESAEQGFTSMKAIKSIGEDVDSECLRKMNLKFNSATKNTSRRSHESISFLCSEI